MAESISVHDIITREELRHQSKRGKTQTAPTPVMTISRQLGSDGTAIARQLGGELDWEVWDRELVDKIANDTHAQREMIVELDEHAASFIKETLQSLSPGKMISSYTYTQYLWGAIMSIGYRGKAIIVGRGANVLLSRALNIRIIASVNYRIENLMEREEISREEAKRRISHSDHERADFIKKVYGENVDDATRYDLILRTDGLGIEEAVQILRAAARVKFPYAEL